LHILKEPKKSEAASLIENGVALKEWDFPVDFVAGLLVGFLSRDAVCVDDKRAFLAFADVSVKLACVFEGHPDGTAKFCAMALAHKERTLIPL
jgi:hypothetical protein